MRIFGLALIQEKENTEGMENVIRHQLAQQMVDTIHDVCGYNINFISPEGKITASTNPERIGTFHEIGRKTAESGQTIEVESDTNFSGTRKGINIPIYYHDAVIAVIGITAEPSEARKYAHLAERISALLLHEQEIGESYRSADEKRAYLIRCIQNEDFGNQDYFDSCLREFHVDPQARYRMLCIEINTRYNLVNISLLEQKVRALFRRIGQEVYAYIYPNRFAGLISSGIYENLISDVLPRSIIRFCSLRWEVKSRLKGPKIPGRTRSQHWLPFAGRSRIWLYSMI